MNQRGILRLIMKEASIFSKEKQSLQKKENELAIIRRKFKEKFAEAKGIKGKGENFDKEKMDELIEIETKRRELCKQINDEKTELKDRIEKSKKRIIAKVRENQEKVFKNRHKFEKVNVKQLKEERKKLKKELGEIKSLKSTTKEKLKEMSVEDRRKVEEAQRKYKENTNRINEINEKLKMEDLFFGKKPQEIFRRNKVIIKKVEEQFTIDKIDSIVPDKMKVEKEQSDGKKKSETIAKPKKNSDVKNASKQIQQSTNTTEANAIIEQQPIYGSGANVVQQQPGQQLQQTYNNYLDGVAVNGLYDIGGNISIFEAQQIAVFNFGNQEGLVFLKDRRKERREMFKRLNIKKKVGFRDLRKVNPVVIKILEQIENGDMMIDEYLQSIKGEKKFNFELNHNLEGLNFFQKIKRNIQAKFEQKCGANVVGKLFDKDYSQTFGTAEQTDYTLGKQAGETQFRSGVRADEETIHRTEAVGQRAGQSIGKEGAKGNLTQEVQGDIVIE